MMTPILQHLFLCETIDFGLFHPDPCQQWFPLVVDGYVSYAQVLCRIKTVVCRHRHLPNSEEGMQQEAHNIFYLHTRSPMQPLSAVEEEAYVIGSCSLSLVAPDCCATSNSSYMLQFQHGWSSCTIMPCICLTADKYTLMVLCSSICEVSTKTTQHTFIHTQRTEPCLLAKH